MKAWPSHSRILLSPSPTAHLSSIFLRDLSQCYDHPKAFIERCMPFPYYHNVHNKLLLKALTLDVESTASAMALLWESGYLVFVQILSTQRGIWSFNFSITSVWLVIWERPIMTLIKFFRRMMSSYAVILRGDMMWRLTHYYIIDYMRPYQNILGGGHKNQLPQLMHAINRGGIFLLTEAVTFVAYFWRRSS